VWRMSSNRHRHPQIAPRRPLGSQLRALRSAAIRPANAQLVMTPSRKRGERIHTRRAARLLGLAPRPS
jgi:hypothetical protein